MTLRVSGKNMDVGEALRSKALEHFDATVAKYFDGGYEGHLTLSHDGAGFTADCVVHLDTGALLQAQAEAVDATAAYEAMAANIEKRLRRYNRKLRSHRRRPEDENGIAQSYVLAAPDDDTELDVDFSPAVIAETVESAENIDLARAERAKERAEERIREARLNHDGSVDRDRAEAALARAINRIKVAGMRRATAR